MFNVLMVYTTIFSYIIIIKKFINYDNLIDFVCFVIYKKIVEIIINLVVRISNVKIVEVKSLILKIIEIDRNSMYMKIALIK